MYFKVKWAFTLPVVARGEKMVSNKRYFRGLTGILKTFTSRTKGSCAV